MDFHERRYEAMNLTNESMSDMLDVNPRTLRRVDVDTVCLREVTQAEMSVRLVRCAPSVFTQARHSWCTVVMFGAWFEIMPMIELDLPEPHRQRHVIASAGWVKDLIACATSDCPAFARSVRAEDTAVELVTERNERIPLRSEWCSGCN